jgi:hypothetical protein
VKLRIWGRARIGGGWLWYWEIRDVDGAVLTRHRETTWGAALTMGWLEGEHAHQLLDG